MIEKLRPSFRGVTLKQLRALDAAISEGSVSGAAKVLNVTPPAISMQIRLLEENAGMPLFERTDRGLRPTDAGILLLQTTHRIEAALNECAGALEDLSGIGVGRVTVGLVSTTKYFAPRALAAFAKEHPRIDVRLSVENRQKTIHALEKYDIDFAIMGRPPGAFDVDHAVIGDHPHIIIAAPDHPMASGRSLSLSDLAEERFLVREEGSGTRLLMQRLFAEAGLSPKVAMEIGSNETIKQAVMAGLGIALISGHTVAYELHDGRLAMLNVSGLPVVRTWYVVKRRDKQFLPAARALWNFLAASGVAFIPPIEAEAAGRAAPSTSESGRTHPALGREGPATHHSHAAGDLGCGGDDLTGAAAGTEVSAPQTEAAVRVGRK